MAREACADKLFQEIDRQKIQQGIRRDKDVKEIFLAERNVEGVCDFTRYVNLQHLWLSNNRLRKVPHLLGNCCLTELYLQYNLLKDVTGMLGHLTLLETLMLQGNQLTELEKVTCELGRMQNLTVLSLFDNPLSQEKGYRNYVLYHAASVKLLDRKEVLKGERDKARALYDQENEAVRDTIAFLRRSQGPPDLYYRRPTSYTVTQPVLSPLTEMSPDKATQVLEDELEDLFYKRMKTKALWTYSYFDWSKIPKPSKKTTDASNDKLPRAVASAAEFVSVVFK